MKFLHRSKGFTPRGWYKLITSRRPGALTLGPFRTLAEAKAAAEDRNERSIQWKKSHHWLDDGTEHVEYYGDNDYEIHLLIGT